MFAVGDDDQSIYAFRGANVGNMQQFERDFGVERTVIKLEQNYRSHGNILDAANALDPPEPQRVWARTCGRARARASRCASIEAATDAEEARFIVDEVRALRARALRSTDIALLYRSNAQSRVLEHALFSAGIPYRVYGGLRFFERAEVKHALAYLRLIANPDDDGAFLRVINFPPRGIGARTLEQLQDAARGQRRRASGRLRAHRGTAAEAGQAASGPSCALIERMRAATEALPLPEAVEHVIERSAACWPTTSAERDGQDRVENLRELVTAADAFVREAELAVGRRLANASMSTRKRPKEGRRRAPPIR